MPYRDRPPSYGSTLRDVASGSPDTYARIAFAGGQAQADSHLRQGYGVGDDVANIGAGIGQGIQQYQQMKEQKKRSQAIDELFAGEEMPDPKNIIRVFGPKEGLDIIKGLNAIHPEAKNTYKDRMEQARDAARGIQALPVDKQPQAYALARTSLVNNKVFTPEEAPEEFTPEFITQLANYGVQPKEKEGFTLTPGQTRFGPDGRPIADVPAAPKEAAPFNLGPGDVRYDGQGNVIAQRAPAPEKASKERIWVIRDGKPLRVSEADYRPGDLPANTREQGRPVTSGDAGKIADFDTSLDDLNKLAESIGGSKATGTAARIGAALPNIVTEATGIGTEAKAKQATIDRVKQVIGKALEGGVLRKEDEAKYEKILPTIGDPPDVVKAKLDGLWKAIQQRKQTQIESLADAGYDVKKFEARAPREREAPAGGPKQFKTDAEAEAGFAALKSGEEFIGPDGQKRRKP